MDPNEYTSIGPQFFNDDILIDDIIFFYEQSIEEAQSLFSKSPAIPRTNMQVPEIRSTHPSTLTNGQYIPIERTKSSQPGPKKEQNTEPPIKQDQFQGPSKNKSTNQNSWFRGQCQKKSGVFKMECKKLHAIF